jgi:hypothetical protein
LPCLRVDFGWYLSLSTLVSQICHVVPFISSISACDVCSILILPSISYVQKFLSCFGFF